MDQGATPGDVQFWGTMGSFFVVYGAWVLAAALAVFVVIMLMVWFRGRTPGERIGRT